MKDYQIRVQEEYTALDEKVRKLQLFILKGPQFMALSERERHLLQQQLGAMESYRAVLASRIQIFHDQSRDELVEWFRNALALPGFEVFQDFDGEGRMIGVSARITRQEAVVRRLVTR